MKIRAFADDVVVIIEDPIQGINKLFQEIGKFGKYSGLRVNKGKTVMITKNMTKQEKGLLREISGCKIEKKLKYLGIWIAKDNIKLFDNNYLPVWKKIKDNLIM